MVSTTTATTVGRAEAHLCTFHLGSGDESMTGWQNLFDFVWMNTESCQPQTVSKVAFPLVLPDNEMRIGGCHTVSAWRVHIWKGTLNSVSGNTLLPLCSCWDEYGWVTQLTCPCMAEEVPRASVPAFDWSIAREKIHFQCHLRAGKVWMVVGVIIYLERCLRQADTLALAISWILFRMYHKMYLFNSSFQIQTFCVVTESTWEASSLIYSVVLESIKLQEPLSYRCSSAREYRHFSEDICTK